MLDPHVRMTRVLLTSVLFLITACSPGPRGEVQDPTPSPETGQVTDPQVEEGEKTYQWDASPEMTIDPSIIYLATFETEKGDILIELFADKAPVTVNNFVFLAREGYYDDTTFHRVISEFMAQGGDRTGTGGGNPGYQFPDEFDPSLLFDQAGQLAMANGGPNTNGSQFFITLDPTPWLTGYHTIFGKVVEGMEVVKSLTLRDPSANPNYPGDRLIGIEVEETTVSLLPTPTPMPEAVSPELVEGRPLAEIEAGLREGLFTHRPDMVIDPNLKYVATVQTSKGVISLELDSSIAPESVNNFFVLANLGYWDDYPIEFIQPGTFVRTDLPGGRFGRDIGYTVPLEPGLSNTLGAVGYWLRQDLQASSGSRFYILLSDVTAMDGTFAVFGYVTQGQEVLDQLTLEDAILRISVQEQ